MSSNTNKVKAKNTIRRMMEGKTYWTFAYEWEKATGEILCAYTRTRQAGLAKLEKAEQRKQRLERGRRDG